MTAFALIIGVALGVVWHALATHGDRAQMRARLQRAHRRIRDLRDERAGQDSLLDSYRRNNQRLTDFIRDQRLLPDAESAGETTPLHDSLAVERFAAEMDEGLRLILGEGS